MKVLSGVLFLFQKTYSLVDVALFIHFVEKLSESGSQINQC